MPRSKQAYKVASLLDSSKGFQIVVLDYRFVRKEVENSRFVIRLKFSQNQPISCNFRKRHETLSMKYNVAKR